MTKKRVIRRKKRMSAIYKKELKSYFNTGIGWLFLAATLCLVGLYFTIYCLLYGYPYISYALTSVSFLYFITIPVLTMKILAEERKQKTDQLILTAPVSIGKIVLGKYLAMLSILAIAMVVICIYPLVLSRFGTVPMLQSYVAILGYFALGAVSIAIGMFISSITESQVIAAVLSFGVLFLGYMMKNICSLISTNGNFITKILGVFDLDSPLENFLNGIFDVSSLVYYVTLILLFIFLTCQSIEKRRWSVSSKSLKTGAYSVGLIIVGIVATVLVNLVIKEVPIEYTQFDITSQKLYSLTSDTKNYIKGLTKDVDIYVISSKDEQDDAINKSLEMYADMSSHINVEYKDPTVYPTFYKEYSSSMTKKSIVVVCGEKSKVINYSDMYEYNVDYTTYTQTTTGYDGEGRLTSAISYVTTDDMPVIYQVKGHDEVELEDTFTDAVEKLNMEVKSLNLMENDAVPEDAECITILAPSSDFSEDDANKVIDYINGGGKVILSTAYTDKELPNFDKILSALGITNTYAMIAEGNSSNYYQSPFFTLPTVQSSDYTSAVSSSKYIFSPYSVALTFDTDNTDYTYTKLLETSDAAYAKKNVSQMTDYTKTDSDITGPFTEGMLVEKNISGSEDTKATVAVFASSYLFTSSADSMVSGNNLSLFSGLLGKLVSTDDNAAAFTIPVKEYTLAQMTIPSKSVVIIGALVTVIIPLALLITGLVIWLKRRRR